ncbi:MAG: type VI secretion system protein TssA [Rhodothermia bacterium]|nr:type VI secretion system protein TssA [Rhodothermia bacterium]
MAEAEEHTDDAAGVEVEAASSEAATSESAAAGAEEASQLIESLAKPISKATPCGENVAYEEELESIKDEIDKLSEHDYELVARLSQKLLSEKTKDILVASYLAVGLTMTRGLPGLAEGVGVLNMLCDTYWDGLYPAKRRMAARRSALQFFAERATGLLEGWRPEVSDREPVETSLARLAQLQEFTLSEMGEHAPVLSGLKRALEEILRRLPKDKPADAPTPAPDAAPTNESAGLDSSTAAAALTEISSPTEANTAVTKASSFLRQSDKTNPVPYRVLRALRWSQIKTEPPNESGKTRIPAPLQQRRAFLEGLLGEGEAEKLVEEGEASFQAGSFHLWLDLQRLLAEAMSVLGQDYLAARQAVVEETAILIRRLPSLPSLTYSDGTAFASGLTEEWLQAEVVNALTGSEAVQLAAVTSSDQPGELQEQQKEATKKLQKGDLAGALAIMQEGSDRDKSAKDRFRRQLYLASLCMKGGKAAVARPILENLDKDIVAHGLDSWDPDLALEAWSQLYSCYRAITKAAAAAEKAALKEDTEDIFEKIVRLDAGFALSLSGKK